MMEWYELRIAEPRKSSLTFSLIKDTDNDIL